MTKKSYFAVIDTETTSGNKVMSIGVVIADAGTKNIVDSKYYLINPEYKYGGMYSAALKMPGIKETITDSRKNVLVHIDSLLKQYKVERILAYNASFDKKHLPELHLYTWCDIMRLAAYRQYNPKIPAYAECYGTGKLKSGYGVEPILRMLSGNSGYHETHNAYFDAVDELQIVQLLKHSIEVYDNAIIR